MNRKSRAKDFELVNNKPYVSTRVAATVCGVTIQSFNNWRRDENPPPVDNRSGMVSLEELGQWIRSEQVLKPGRGGTGFPYLPNVDRLYKNTDVGKEAPETRLKRLQADKVQLELDKSRGLLIPVDEVQQVWSRILSRVRTRLLRLPVATAPFVTGLSDVHQVQQRLSDQVSEALEELAAGDDDGHLRLGTSETVDGDYGDEPSQVADVGERGGPERDASSATVAPS